MTAIALTTLFLTSQTNSRSGGQTIVEYLKFPNEKLKIGTAAYLIAEALDSNASFPMYLKEIARLGDQVMEYVGTNKSPGVHIAAMNTTLFRDNPYRYDTNDYFGLKTKNHTITGLIQSKTGTCFTLPIIYLAVAEYCGFPIYAVSAPQHTFARYVISNYFGPGKHYLDNIEVTGGGGWTPDVVYLDDMKVPLKAFTNKVYLQTLSKREYICYLLSPLAAHAFSDEHNLKKALMYLTLSVQGYSNNVLGWFSLANLYKKLYYGKMTELQNLEDSAGLLQGPIAVTAPSPFQNYNQGQPGSFSKQDRLNLALSAPQPMGNTSPRTGLAFHFQRQKEAILESASDYLQQSRYASSVVSRLGMAPLLKSDYWKEKVNFASVSHSPYTTEEGTPTVRKFIMNGIEYDLPNRQIEYIQKLSEQYKEYFNANK